MPNVISPFLLNKSQNRASKLTFRPKLNLEGQTYPKKPKSAKEPNHNFQDHQTPSKRPNLTYLALRKAEWKFWCRWRCVCGRQLCGLMSYHQYTATVNLCTKRALNTAHTSAMCNSSRLITVKRHENIPSVAGYDSITI